MQARKCVKSEGAENIKFMIWMHEKAEVGSLGRFFTVVGCFSSGSSSVLKNCEIVILLKAELDLKPSC